MKNVVEVLFIFVQFVENEEAVVANSFDFYISCTDSSFTVICDEFIDENPLFEKVVMLSLLIFFGFDT